jgi:tRNA A-37 threonylcarbamoyl transferase component Bud32
VLAVRRPGTPQAEAEGAAFLQRRLRMVFGVFGVLSLLLFGVISMVQEPETQTKLLLPLGAVGLLASWVLSGRPRSFRALKIVDVLLTYTVFAFWVAIAMTDSRKDVFLELGFLVFIILTRAMVVPATGIRTLAILAPMVPVALAVHLERGPLRGWEEDFATEVILYQFLLLVSVGVATRAAQVNWNLRVRASEAKRMGQYALEEKIGEGGMGEVYRATHALLKRPTAVKLLRPEIMSRDTLKRFEHEVRQTSRLSHPNTIRVFDFGLTEEGLLYYAMELLDGEDLDRVVRRDGPLGAARLIHVLTQVCGALDEAHAIGLIHRDIKPSNIMLCRRGREHDIVKVVDFGLVKQSGGEALTQTGSFVGTATTAAPEMFTPGAEVGPAADLYSLGVVAYYAATGSWPFDGTGPADFIAAHLTAAPIPPTRRKHDLPADLESVILHCLEKDPADRPPSALALRQALRQCADGSPADGSPM